MGELDLAHAACAEGLAEGVVSQDPVRCPRPVPRRGISISLLSLAMSPLVFRAIALAVAARRRVRLRWHGYWPWLVGR